MSSSYIHARRPDGSECNIDLFDLENALEGVEPGEYFFSPDSGRIVFHPEPLDFYSEEDDEEEEEDENEETPDDTELLSLEPIESHTRFRWMEEFIDSVHSVSAQSALRHALNQRKPFRHFKDALLEYPALRQQWFQFEADKVKAEAVALIESFDWTVLEVVDGRPVKKIADEVDPAEKLPPTEEESEWILRGASEIAAKGGRKQLSLLLKGSKDKNLLKHHLDHSPVYGKLSFLTVEEIENRIDHVVRAGDLRVEFFGDLPLILLTDSAWERVRSWSNEQECRSVAAADDRTVKETVSGWKQRKRDEQFHLIEAVAALDREAARRILSGWRNVAGKEVRQRIEATLDGLGKD